MLTTRRRKQDEDRCVCHWCAFIGATTVHYAYILKVKQSVQLLDPCNRFCFCTVHLCPSSVPLTSAPLHIFTSSLFKSSHLQICTSSPHLHHSFTSSHLQIFTCTCACTCTCTCALPPSSSSTPTAYPPTPTATYSLQLLLPRLLLLILHLVLLLLLTDCSCYLSWYELLPLTQTTVTKLPCLCST